MTTRIMAMVMIIAALFGFSACRVEVQTNENTEESRTVHLEDKDGVLEKVKEMIQGDIEDGNSIDMMHRLEDVEINNYYFFNGALYVQADSFMYRVEVTDAGEITSYIRYNLKD